MSDVPMIEILATLFFALAILHTFSVKLFQHLALKFREGSVGENFFHLLGEVEIVFGVWAAIFLICYTLDQDSRSAIAYLESRDFIEPMFVFVIMAVCSTRPILQMATQLIEFISKLIPLKRPVSFFISCLIVGPILGSFITEPAAMTVTALILLDKYFKNGISEKLKYATLGLLFVNISIGGTLTSFAAPPVLMVASKWNWDLAHMLTHFGWKAAVAIVTGTLITATRFHKELAKISPAEFNAQKTSKNIPYWVIFSHLIFLIGIILMSHHMVVFVGIFLFFLGLTAVTKEYQNPIKLREGLLVAFFLGGLVVFGGMQSWWLTPLLTKLSALPLYLGATALTAVTDNAALTYLGSQVPDLSELSKYALVAGSVVGGGLTVIANAPNPAGYGILNSSFGKEGINPILLFTNAALPTVIASICFWLF